MKPELTDHLSQLSPLLDDVISRIDSFGLPAIDLVYLSAEALLRIAIGVELLVAQAADGGRALTVKEREELMALILEKRSSDSEIMAALERHGARVQ